MRETTELRSSLSGNDSTMLLEMIQDCLNCACKEDFAALFPNLQDLFPYDYAHAMLGYLYPNDVVSVHDVNISFPDEWIREYASRNYLRMDDTVKKSLCEIGAGVI